MYWMHISNIQNELHFHDFVKIHFQDISLWKSVNLVSITFDLKTLCSVAQNRINAARILRVSETIRFNYKGF